MNRLTYLLILLCGSALAQSGLEGGTVLIDPRGHSANIKMLRFTADGATLVSASDDKTARVWDTKTGILLNTLRGEIDSGNGGMLNSGDIWPSGDVVAVGGMLSTGGQRQRVKFFNYITGEQIGQAFGPDQPMVALDFTTDGKFLAGGSNGNEIIIWNMETMRSISLTGHTDGVYGVAFSPDGQSLVTASYDNTVIFWDVRFLRDSTKEIGTKQHEQHTEKVRTAAFSPKGDYFVTAGEDNRVLLYNGSGDFIRELIKITDPSYGEQYGMGDIHALAFSDDGKKLAIGTGLSNFENVWVVEVPSGKKINSFFKHDNAVMALDFHGNDLIASAGGDNRDIFIWEASTGKIQTSMTGKGRRISAVAFGPDNKIAFSQMMNAPAARTINDFGKPDQVFDLENLAFSPLDDPDGDFVGYNDEFNGTFLRLANVYRIVVYNSAAEIINQIDLDPSKDGAVRSYTFTNDGRIVVGTNYRIIIYDNAGIKIRELNGHNGEVYSLAAKGSKLVSGSADQTIKLWDLNDPGARQMSKEAYKQSLLDQGVTEERLQQFLEQNNLTFDELYQNSVPVEVKPTLTIFPAVDEWIVYTKDNYYATSKNGSKYVGLHVNKGTDNAAEFYHFRQFDYQLNRPDLVLQSIGSSNQPLIAALKAANDKRIKRSGYTVPDGNALTETPKLEMRNQPALVTDQKFKLRFNLSGTDLSQINVTVNSVPVEVSGGNLGAISNAGQFTHMIYDIGFDLLPGKNDIEVWATTRSGISSAVKSFTIAYDPPTTPKADLYVVALGANKYQTADFNLTYAAKDATDVAKLLASPNSLYGNVKSLLLTDNEVTKEVVEKKIQVFLAEAKIQDKVVLFYAGHGVFDKDYNYYLATHNMDFNNPAAQGLAYEALEKVLKGVKARNKIVMMDACHSGEIDKDEVTQATASLNKSTSGIKFRNVGSTSLTYKSSLGMQSSFALMKSMFADLQDETGANIISSAGGMELAMESDQWQNGLFTYVLLDGLKNKTADSNRDGQVDLAELNHHLRSRVSVLSEGRQVPTTRTENVENVFKVW